MRHALLALFLLSPALASADEVKLRNGKTFEDVIAIEREGVVEVRIPGGSLSLPRSSVREIVRSSSTYGEYLDRASALRADGAPGSAWLELARWARGKELLTAAREAALIAAELDPELDGLAPLLRGMGYEFDDGEARWLPLAEVMQRRGMVMAEGRWMTRDEASTLSRQRSEEMREMRRQRLLERMEESAAEVRLAAAQADLSRTSAVAYVPMVAPAVAIPANYGWPVAYFPGFFAPPTVMPAPPVGPAAVPDATQVHRGTLTLDLITRQPGSLFPGELRPPGARSSSSSGGR